VRLRPWILGALLASGSSMARAAETGAPDPAAVDVFARKCASCHTVGKGDRVGPDLKGALDRRGRPWVERFVSAPSAMLDSDPQARGLLTRFNGVRMPDLGLTADQVASLATLIGACSTAPCELQGKFVPVTALTPEQTARGRDLFSGQLALQNGAAPCITCHTVRGTGAVIAGGTFAKDLTNVYARLGDQGLDAALRAPAFRVMGKVFDARPLNESEALALRAFLYDANRGDARGDEALSLPLVAFVLAIVGLGLLNAFWSRRLRGVRSGLVPRAREEKAS
jgi:mono/diheme cytochrome c family protein